MYEKKIAEHVIEFNNILLNTVLPQQRRLFSKFTGYESRIK